MSLFVRDRAFYKKILIIGLPISAQQLITAGVNMMDTIMLGQLDEVALSASAMATQVHQLFLFLSMGLSMGASVLIARYWGAGSRTGLRKSLTLMFRTCLVISLSYTLIVTLFTREIMELLTPEPEVIREGVRYLRWAMPCFFLHGMSLSATIALRNIGRVRIPLYSTICSFFVNIFFNWIFIFGKLGAPAMGVAGAALGTLISRCFEFCFICGFFFLRENRIQFRVKDIFSPCGDLAGEYFRIALPVMVSDMLLGVGNSATAMVAGHIGTVYMSANSITMMTQQISQIFSVGLGQAACIITGNTLGEGDSEKAYRQGVSLTAIGFLVGAACGLAIAAVAVPIVAAYKVTPETRHMAVELMDTVAFLVVFLLPNSIMTKGVLRGGGDTRFLMIADVIFLWVVSIPLGCLAAFVFRWPAPAIFLCLRLDCIVKALWCIRRLRSRKWIKAIRGAEVSAQAGS